MRDDDAKQDAQVSKIDKDPGYAAPLYFTRYGLSRSIFLADRVEPAVVAAGMLTQDEVDRLRQSWQQADTAGCYFASRHTVGIWGRKL